MTRIDELTKQLQETSLNGRELGQTDAVITYIRRMFEDLEVSTITKEHREGALIALSAASVAFRENFAPKYVIGPLIAAVVRLEVSE